MQKKCTKCSVIYYSPLDKWFYKQKQGKGGLIAECKKCHLARDKEYRQTKTGQATISKNNRSCWLRTNYNITIEDYNELFQKQNGCCDLCGIHQSELDRRLAVDHNHETGKVRGLLCIVCNRNLVGVENTKFKIAAEKYLADHGANDA